MYLCIVIFPYGSNSFSLAIKFLKANLLLKMMFNDDINRSIEISLGTCFKGQHRTYSSYKTSMSRNQPMSGLMILILHEFSLHVSLILLSGGALSPYLEYNHECIFP